MGFLDSLLGMFGIGQPKISITIDNNQVKQGALVRGTVTITGGRRPLPLTAVIVKVQQKEEKKTESGTTTNSDTKFELNIPQGGRTVEPNHSMSFDFVVQVPADTNASGGAFRHEIEGSADVPGWDPSAEAKITVLPEQDEWAGEDLKRYHLLPTERHFRHSSVHGDYRLLSVDGGFATTWKTEISLRNADGSARAKIHGWGKAFAASADGKQLAASNGYKQVAIFDASNGEMTAGPFDMGDWIFDLLFLPDGSLLASASEKIFVMDGQGNQTGLIEKLGDSGFYAGGLALAQDGFFITDSNGSRIVKADKAGNVLAGARLSSPSALFSLPDGKVVVECHGSVEVLDGNLKSIKSWDLLGQEGVRYLGQSEHSYTHFKAMPHLSPDGAQVLVQDGSGLLWRMDVGSGEPVQTYDRAVLDHVEDVLWLDGGHFLAITNDGKVRKMSVAGGPAVFEHQDI